MKIKGWDKLNGITYRGYAILNPIYNSIQTEYVAEIMDVTTKQRMSLHLDMEAGFDNQSYLLKLQDIKNKINVQRMISIEMLKSISTFRQIYEMCIEDYIREAEEQSTNPFDSTNSPQYITHHQMPKSSSMLPTFDDFAKMWKQTPAGKFTQTLID